MKESIISQCHAHIQTVDDISKHFHDEILQLLQAYYFQKRGRVHNLNFKSGSMKKDSESSGSFEVTFIITYTQGCQDLSFDENESMRVRFSIVNEDVVFTGEEIPERDTNEF